MALDSITNWTKGEKKKEETIGTKKMLGGEGSKRHQTIGFCKHNVA
jgi:hypothetical protein